MKPETLLAAYTAISKRKYTTRKKMASLCSFTVMTAGNAARELKRLELVTEKQYPSAGKLSPVHMSISLISVLGDSIALSTFNEAFKVILARARKRNYSFHLVEDIATLLTESYVSDPNFPFIFCQGIPELELKIFGDLLPEYIVIPKGTKDLKNFITSQLIAKKIEQKALAKKE